MDQNSNKVILLGGNHHNGLGLVRSFGRNGICPYGIVIGKGAHNSFVTKSKYWEKTWSVDREDEAIDIMLSVFSNETKKPVVIPWSDGAAEAIDENYERLREYFILPSINEKQGAIIELMDKDRQIEYARQFGLKMLPSRIVRLEQEEAYEPDYPVILKAVSSIEGGKADMFICAGKNDYTQSLEVLKKRGYSRILAQKYLSGRREYVVTGAISSKRYSFSVVRHMRQWPPSFGTGSFSETVRGKKILDFCEYTLKKISESGYRGTIDFELFESDSGEFYLNEINWRSSGRNFVSKFTGVESAYMYYCDVTGKEYETEPAGRVHVYSMNEVTDIKHVLRRNISLVRWLSDLSKTKSFAIWDTSDMGPVVKRYMGMAQKFAGRNRS